MSKKDDNRNSRREQVVAGLMECLKTKPFQDLTVKDIAKAAGLSHGLIHYYFESKEEILLELVRVSMQDYLSSMRRLSARLDAGLTDSPYFLDNLAELAQDFYRDEIRGYFAPYCFIWSMGFYDAGLNEIVSEVYNGYKQMLIETIRRHSPPGVDAEAVACILIPFFEGIVATANTFKQDTAEIVRIVSRFSDMLSASMHKK